ncbi:peptide chain release factor 1 [Acarospora aff. strigata]|nr:peptide chain release factor 1 [Acarospora aff. strigata]
MADKAKGKDAPTNPRGIPYAPFVDKVEDYVSSRAEVDSTMKSFQEMISKYQFMELSTQRRSAGLRDKIPDIQKTLETVRFLKTRTSTSAPLKTTFSLAPTLYAHATIAPPSSPSSTSSTTKEQEQEAEQEVYLWLGANVMLSYPVSEAEDLLDEKLEAARKALAGCEEDLEFLREQVTTLEVATARVYNWDVTQRRKDKAEPHDGDGDGDDGETKRLPNG